MVGIDIVDLGDPLLKKRNQRALQLIKHPVDSFSSIPDTFWLLWTAKEAVYKATKSGKPFAPKSIPIQMTSDSSRSTIFSSGVYQGTLYFNHHFILAICWEKVMPNFHVYFSQKGFDSQSIRHQIKRYFNAEATIVNDDLGAPLLMMDNHPISLSHHGQFGAFAFIE